MPPLDPAWIGGIGTVLLGIAAKAIQRYRSSARQERPLFHNGERAAIQQALHLMMEAQTGTANRVTTLEARLRQEIQDARQEHGELHDRITYLEERMNARGKPVT